MNKTLQQGFIQVYTGNGKGKTTAAIGQAVRAAGYGLKTYFVMFMKEFPYNEVKSLKNLKDFITLVQVGKDDFVYKKVPPSETEKLAIKKTLDETKNKMLSGEYDLIVLDEIFVSIFFGLIDKEEVISFICSKPENVELILTGRYCPKEIINKADLVTEMKEVKHYYEKGVLSRRGIES
ncbi:MAG TPA: cob(I)yrinic acid a,c-diamide adenosyltransferase [Ignavibacteriaceae bacterium]